MSSSAIGCERESTQRGVTITGRWNTRSRITSNAAEPGPMTIPARSSVTGTGPARRISPVSPRDIRCADEAPGGTSPPR